MVGQHLCLIDPPYDHRTHQMPNFSAPTMVAEWWPVAESGRTWRGNTYACGA